MSTLQYIVDKIKAENPLHGKKLTKKIASVSEEYLERASQFFARYETMLSDLGKDIDYSIDCYLKMIADVNYESVQFIQTGKYSSTSFEEVNKRVYGNPEVMDYYMHGLLLSQFLWTHHYDILLFFNEMVGKQKGDVNQYLEVGGGHGLYISEATEILPDANFDLVDISPVSLSIAKKMTEGKGINYVLSDIFEYHKDASYDFITMGEVLEHVEDPLALLKQLHRLVKPGGKVFITTPTNAPAIDHIFLFNNTDEVKSLIKEAGFDILESRNFVSEDIDEETANRMKISVMFAGLLQKTA